MDPRADDAELLTRMKADLPTLRDLLASANGRDYEDPIHRFYHHSQRVFNLQNRTEEIVAALRRLLPYERSTRCSSRSLDKEPAKSSRSNSNAEWSRHTRPVLEAFFHARYFLEMAVHYAKLAEPPTVLPSGWAAFSASTDSDRPAPAYGKTRSTSGPSLSRRSRVRRPRRCRLLSSGAG